MLDPEDIRKRDHWLLEIRDMAFKTLTIVGSDYHGEPTTKFDVERLLRDALGLEAARCDGRVIVSHGRRLRLPDSAKK